MYHGPLVRSREIARLIDIRTLSFGLGSVENEEKVFDLAATWLGVQRKAENMKYRSHNDENNLTRNSDEEV